MRTIDERVWGRAIKTPGGCWLYAGFINPNGYGCVSWDGQRTGVHRVSWILANGRDLRPDQVIDHLCRNRRCVNPVHLDATTQKINKQRAAKRTLGLFCPHGHERSKENAYLHKDGSKQCVVCMRARRPLKKNEMVEDE